MAASIAHANPNFPTHRLHRRCVFLLSCLLLWTPLNSQAEPEELLTNDTTEQQATAPIPLLTTLTEKLIDGSYSDKTDAIAFISENSNDALPILTAIVNGDLQFDQSSRRIYQLIDSQVVSFIDESLQLQVVDNAIDSQQLDKVRINNRLRGQLRQAIAALQLENTDARIRAAAVGDMLNKLDDTALAQIRDYRKNEQNSKVQQLMDIALAIGTLQNSSDNTALASAIDTLASSLEPAALNSLRQFNEATDNRSLKKQSAEAIKRIEGKRQFFAHLETLFFGLSFGSVLVLAGIGLAITFGVMGVINMAHGELIMLGAYTTFVIQQLMPNMIGLSIIVAIPAAFLVSALAGIAMERLVIRHLYGRPLETLLATFGISLILQQAVRSVFSPLNRSVITPDWMSGMLQINSVFSLTWNRFYIIIFCLMVFAVLLFIMKKSALGLQVRAVSQNRLMARAMGVRSTRVDILTFGLGAGIAGVAGVALSLLTNVGPNLGQAYIIDSFIVVVFGGVGNLFGTLVAGMSLGVANKILEPWAGAVLAKILLLVFIILFIQKRPQGLFPQRGRAVEG